MSEAVVPLLDHLVIDTREHLGDAAAVMERLGFAVTPTSHHTLGSDNRLIILSSNYIELLGFESAEALTRKELLNFPTGLNGIVFRAEDASELYRMLSERGLPVEPPLEFSRPVAVGSKIETARFRTVRFKPGLFGDVRVYFCQHLTPELVWMAEWQRHGNGAVDVVGVTMVAEQAKNAVDLFARVFGSDSVATSADGWVLQAKNARIDIRGASDYRKEHSDDANRFDGRSTFFPKYEIEAKESLNVGIELISRGASWR